MFWLRRACPTRSRPARRPRTTLSPTLALRDGQPWMAFGTPGGDQQDQWTLQFFLTRRLRPRPAGGDRRAAFHTDHFPSSFFPRRAPGPALSSRSASNGLHAERLRRRSAPPCRGRRPLVARAGCCAVGRDPATGFLAGRRQPPRPSGLRRTAGGAPSSTVSLPGAARDRRNVACRSRRRRLDLGGVLDQLGPALPLPQAAGRRGGGGASSSATGLHPGVEPRAGPRPAVRRWRGPAGRAPPGARRRHDRLPRAPLAGDARRGRRRHRSRVPGRDCARARRAECARLASWSSREPSGPPARRFEFLQWLERRAAFFRRGAGSIGPRDPSQSSAAPPRPVRPRPSRPPSTSTTARPTSAAAR